MTKVAKKVFLILMCVIIVLSFASCVNKSEGTDNDWASDFDLLKQVLEYIDTHYIDGLDVDAADILAAYAVTAGLDSFSYLTDGIAGGNGSAGIGIILSVTPYNEYRISTIIDNSPASEEKDDGFALMRGDEIYAVNGKRVEGLTRSYFEGFSAGEAGTVLNLSIKRNGIILPDTYDYTKTELTFPEAVYIDDLGGAISEELGYIRLRSFAGTAAADFDNCMSEFATDGNSGLILDLRGNLGGSSSILEEIASYFVPLDDSVSRKILELDYKEDGIAKRMEVKVKKNNYIDMPIFILADSQTASAAEALIGAVRAFNGANTCIIGSPTFGKGVFQNAPFMLFDKQGEENYAFYISIVTGYYYIVDPLVEGGRYNIHHNPITPDISRAPSAVMGELYSDSEIIAANTAFLALAAVE